MTLTAPGCGMGDVLAEDVRKRLEKLPEIGTAKLPKTPDDVPFAECVAAYSPSCTARSAAVIVPAPQQAPTRMIGFIFRM